MLLLPAPLSLRFPIARESLRDILTSITKLTKIQEAIQLLDRDEQQRLRIWMGEAPLDLDKDSPELEAELLKAVEGPHAPLVRKELEQITERAIRAFGLAIPVGTGSKLGISAAGLDSERC